MYLSILIMLNWMQLACGLPLNPGLLRLNPSQLLLLFLQLIVPVLLLLLQLRLLLVRLMGALVIVLLLICWSVLYMPLAFPPLRNLLYCCLRCCLGRGHALHIAGPLQP